MSKQLRVKVNGNPYEVDIKDFSGTTAELSINGTDYSIEIEETGGAAMPVVSKPAAAPAPSARPAPALPPSSAIWRRISPECA